MVQTDMKDDVVVRMINPQLLEVDSHFDPDSAVGVKLGRSFTSDRYPYHKFFFDQDNGHNRVYCIDLFDNKLVYVVTLRFNVEYRLNGSRYSFSKITKTKKEISHV